MTVQQGVAPPIEGRSGVRTGAWAATADPRIVAAAFGVALVAVGMALFQTISEVVVTWYGSVTFNHGFLILPICAYLAWRRRAEIAVTPFAPSWIGLLLLLFACGVWLLGAVAGTVVVQQFAAVAIIQATVLTLFGWRLVKLLQFPLLYLYFAVPFGLSLVPPLQDVTARFSVELLRLVGIPVFVDGNMISVSNGNFLVAEACSGIRYLIASIALGVLLAGLMYRSWRRRIFFLVLSIAVPVVANGIRAFGIILIAHLTNNEYATGIDHIFYGWIFFTLVTFVLLSIGMAMSEPEEAPFQAPAIANRPALSARPVILAALLAVAAVWATKAYAGYVNLPMPVAATALISPHVTPPWQAADGAVDPLQPRIYHADTELHQSFEADGAKVYLHVGYYAQQRHGAEAVSSQHEFTKSGTEMSNATGETAVTLAGTNLSVNYVRIPLGHGGRLIWYWYWVDGRFVGNPYWAKLLQLKAKLLRGPQAAALVLIATDYREYPNEAERRLGGFLSQAPALQSMLAAASGR